MQYLYKLLVAVATRLKNLTMNPIRNFVRNLQMMVNTNVIANKIIKPVTKKFRDLFHIKPRSETEYYSVGKLLIAKKLVAVFIVACCIAVFAYFNMVAEPVEKTVTTTTGIITDVTYDYDDMKLAEYSGKANIRAAGGNIVYTGDIKDGVCEGTGVLYNQSGVLVYEGEFAGNVYNGQGKEYYPDGTLQYEGAFVQNAHEGEGILYYPSGTVKYKGSFAGGFFCGTGYEYTESGSLQYEGTFQNSLYHGTGILYYEDGNKKYEGEFVMGSPQGMGTLYTSAGRPYYQGVVKNGEVSYEALISLSLGEIEKMFYEEPHIYYTLDSTCFVYDTAQVVLESDCMVRIVTNEILDKEGAPISNEGDGWYLPEGAQDAVTLDTSKDKETDEEASKDTESTEDKEEDKEDDTKDDQLIASLSELIDQVNQAQEEPGDADMPTDYITAEQKIYYYINNSEWVAEEDLDKSAIKIEGVTAYTDDLSSPFPADEEAVATNGVTELSDCIAIEKIRLRTPTAFSNIVFEEISKNYGYTYIKNINYAQAIYEEIVDKEDFSYRLCYQIDNAETLYYIKISGMQ